MIFLCGRVEFLVVSTHSPPCDGPLWDQFILIVFYDRHAPFLGHHLDRADLVAMWHEIDNPSVKKF